MTDDGGTAPARAVKTPADLRVFSYAVAEKADVYVAAVEVLMAARERFRLQLRPAEVARDLRAAGIDLENDEVSSLLVALTRGVGAGERRFDGRPPPSLRGGAGAQAAPVVHHRSLNLDPPIDLR